MKKLVKKSAEEKSSKAIEEFVATYPDSIVAQMVNHYSGKKPAVKAEEHIGYA